MALHAKKLLSGAPLSLIPSTALLWPLYRAASLSWMRVTMPYSAQQRRLNSLQRVCHAHLWEQ